jgi:hypothetical protein
MARHPGNEPRQNVGNGIMHLLRLPAIRATLRSPAGLIKIQLLIGLFGFQLPRRAFRAARLFHLWIRRVLQ